MSERYPDEYWLADFERRLSDGRLLTREESLALIAELRRVRLEQSELRAALEPLQIELTQHRYTPRPDEWFYDVPDICDGGRVKAQRMRCVLPCSTCIGEPSSSGRSGTTWTRPTTTCAPSSIRPTLAPGSTHGGGRWMDKLVLIRGVGSAN
jgi:hypothetical protein